MDCGGRATAATPLSDGVAGAILGHPPQSGVCPVPRQPPQSMTQPTFHSPKTICHKPGPKKIQIAAAIAR